MRSLGPSPSWRRHPPKRRTQSDGNSRHRSDDFSTLIVHEAAQFARRIHLRTLDRHPPGKAPAFVIVADAPVQRNSHPDPVRATSRSAIYGPVGVRRLRCPVCRRVPGVGAGLAGSRAQRQTCTARSQRSLILVVHPFQSRSLAGRYSEAIGLTIDGARQIQPMQKQPKIRSNHSTPSALKTASTGSE